MAVTAAAGGARGAKARAVATVFGGSGFIGRHVVQRLAAEGWIVRAAVRDVEAAMFLKPMGAPGQVVLLRAPITDEERVAAAVAGAHLVVNLVGILYEKGRATFEAIHHEGAARVARAAAAAGARTLVHISALGADGGSESAYARSKARGEAAVRAAFPDATILRPSVVFGTDDGFINRFATLAQFLPVLPVYGGGTTRFQPVYVGDVADAVMRAVHDPGTRGQTYELGGPRIYSFRDLMTYILAQTGRRRCLLDLPFSVARLQAAVLEWLPVPPLTRDQVILLQHDNVVGEGVRTLADLGIAPSPLEAVAPAYLRRFRRGGGAAPRAAA